MYTEWATVDRFDNPNRTVFQPILFPLPGLNPIPIVHGIGQTPDLFDFNRFSEEPEGRPQVYTPSSSRQLPIRLRIDPQAAQVSQNLLHRSCR